MMNGSTQRKHIGSVNRIRQINESWNLGRGVIRFGPGGMRGVTSVSIADMVIVICRSLT